LRKVLSQSRGLGGREWPRIRGRPFAQRCAGRGLGGGQAVKRQALRTEPVRRVGRQLRLTFRTVPDIGHSRFPSQIRISFSVGRNIAKRENPRGAMDVSLSYSFAGQ